MISKTLKRQNESTEYWDAENPVVGEDVLAFDTTQGKFKLGNGRSTWSQLPFFTNDNQRDAAQNAAIERRAPTSQGLALRMALKSTLPVVLIVQGDSTGNATDEWPYLLTEALAAAYPTRRVLHSFWNDTSHSYVTPTIVQAATEGYLDVTSANLAHLNDTSKVAISADLVIRAKVRSTDVDYSGATRTIAAKYGGTDAERSWRLYIHPTNGLTLNWQESAGAVYRSATIASMAQLSAAFADNADFYVGVELDVNNGAGQYTVRGLTSTNGTTWTTLGTAVTGSTGTSSLKVSTGYLKVGGRGDASTNTDPWNGRVYWLEVSDGIGASDRIVARFQPGLASRISAWTDAHGNPWAKSASGLTVGSPLLLVLNASSPGQDAGYSVTRWASQAGLRPDLAIISYAHNGPSVSTVVDYATTTFAPLLDQWTSSWPQVPVMVTLQSPQVSPRTSDEVEDHSRRIRGVASLSAARKLPLIDAFAPLLADPATYVQADGVHPTPAGSLVWAEAVRQALRPAVT